MTEPANRAATCGVLVTFLPDDDLADRARVVLDQVARLLIIDNSGSGLPVLERLEADDRVEVVRNRENLGQARALNQGLELAGELGFAWALLLDQDSTLEPFLLDGLFEVLDRCGEADQVAVVGPNYDQGGASAPLVPEKGPGWLERPTVITSGSLVRLSACSEIGGMDEGLFIDYVDHDFCLRARARGYRVLLATRLLMHHTIGDVSRHRVGWASAGTTNHGPARRYYQTRNRIRVYLRHGWREPGWLLHDLPAALRSLLRMMLFEKDRPAKIGRSLQGIWHGLRGKTGPLES